MCNCVYKVPCVNCDKTYVAVLLSNDNNNTADILVKKEPAGLVRSDGKHPDGCTLIPWRGGTFDMACHSLHHDGCNIRDAASCTAGVTAEQAVDRKCIKYTELTAGHEVQPVAVESHGPLSEATASLLVNLTSNIFERSGEPLETQFLLLRVSMLIQRFNSILYHETFSVEEDTDT